MELVLTLPAELQAPWVVRGALGALAPFLPVAAADDVPLLATELVTNAIKYGGLTPSDDLEVRAAASPERVRVEVAGGRRPFPRRRIKPTPEQSSGWGLVIVEGLSNRWGLRRTMKGTTVWFEIDGARSSSMETLSPNLSRSRLGWKTFKSRQRTRGIGSRAS